MLGLGNSISSSGAPESDDLSRITDLELWLKNGTGLNDGSGGAVTSGKVVQWDDSSGNGNNVRQSVSDNQATYKGGGLAFDDANIEHYDLAGAISIAKGTSSTTGGFCIAVVWDVDKNTCTVLSEDANEFFEFKTNKELRFSGDKDSSTTSIFYAESGTPFALGEKMVILFNRTAGSSGAFSIYKNGSAVTIAADGTDPGDSTLTDAGDNVMGFDIDTLGVKGDSTQPFDGDIYELAFWSKSLDTTEIAYVSSYLTTVHGI